MKFLGEKRKELYRDFISQHIPDNIKIYVEPFGGSFSVALHLIEEREENSPEKFIYNDINKYDLIIYADKIYHLDYKEIFKMYDDKNTFFYLDPPYYQREFIYDGCKKYTELFHIELRDNIKNLKGNFLLSYNNSTFIKDLYNYDFDIIEYNGDNILFKNEILIKKYNER